MTYLRDVLTRYLKARIPSIQKHFSSVKSSYTSSKASQIEALPGIEAPLCERPAVYAAPVAEIVQFKRRASEQIDSIGDSWLRLDEGPSFEQLRVELDWLIEDAVVLNSAVWGSLEPTTTLEMRIGLDTLKALWAQRIQDRVPLQYLTKAAFWRDMVLAVSSDVLIPRPETELVIDFVKEGLKEDQRLGFGLWADLGTGSGALAIGVARLLGNVKVYGVDISDTALAIAKFNSERLGVSDRVHFLQGDWFEPLQGMKFSGIVSNPPYIPSKILKGLQMEVGCYEPWLALNGGDGLATDSLSPICRHAAQHLLPGGILILETDGGEQAIHISNVLKQTGSFEAVHIKSDLRRVGRFVTAIKRNDP